MNKQIEISIVIATFNREKNLFKIIKAFEKQISILKCQFEIILCDSNSNKRISIINYIKQFNNLKIHYYNCPINHQAYKRNYGLKKSEGKYVIFIDDDCIPENRFLDSYLKILRLNRKNVVYCGQVKYFQFNENKNLIKYRQSRLVNHLEQKKNISIKNFISMNMGINKKFLHLKKIFFNNKFKYYGFEDFEFAYRLLKSSFRIKLIKPLVFHYDNRNFKMFLKKYNYLGEFGILDITQINLEAAKKSIFYQIDTNILLNKFIKIHKIIYFISMLQKSILFIEKRSYFYLSFIYKIGIFVAFLLGMIKRKKNYKENNLLKLNSWYK